MSVYDYEAAPPPPPMYQAKAVKDESLKDEVRYELHFFNKLFNEWVKIHESETKKDLKLKKEHEKERKKMYGEVFKYRIVRCITKKEVVG
jgi:hypothetical protein